MSDTTIPVSALYCASFGSNKNLDFFTTSYFNKLSISSRVATYATFLILISDGTKKDNTFKYIKTIKDINPKLETLSKKSDAILASNIKVSLNYLEFYLQRNTKTNNEYFQKEITS